MKAVPLAKGSQLKCMELLVKCRLFWGRKLNEQSDHTTYTVYTQPDNLSYYSFHDARGQTHFAGMILTNIFTTKTFYFNFFL